MIKDCFLDIDYSKFLAADYTKHIGSCISHQIYELTDIHESFGGFPDTYSLSNTTIHQLWWGTEDIDFQELEKQLGIEVITVSTIKQPPGNIVPIHRDTFFQIKQRHPDRKEPKVRANIYMEDWKVGHMIQYQNQWREWKTSDHWIKGQGFIWDSEPLHVSANVGFQDKYTMQVSGFLK
jgi:hypothetical protein